MNDADFAIGTARNDFIEHEGNLSLFGVSVLTEAGLDADHFQGVFTAECHFI